MLPYFVKKVENKEFYNLQAFYKSSLRMIYLENIYSYYVHYVRYNSMECVALAFGRAPNVCVIKNTLPRRKLVLIPIYRFPRPLPHFRASFRMRHHR
ncbi:hypothetical protein WN55_02289 [Dufourea novaeangliae]|uniref:Uncharacterized protein n=1 Tax=Dufourea novaeangliae TaxID=178035 RepID=A0A154PG06_DUFNO|nr:hypothetical protein WN55_02289 [Dufourea novaeangliae]